MIFIFLHFSSFPHGSFPFFPFYFFSSFHFFLLSGDIPFSLLSLTFSFISLALLPQISFIFPPFFFTKLAWNSLNNLFKLAATWKPVYFGQEQPNLEFLSCTKLLPPLTAENSPFHRPPWARPRSGRASRSSTTPVAAPNHLSRELTRNPHRLRSPSP